MSETQKPPEEKGPSKGALKKAQAKAEKAAKKAEHAANKAKEELPIRPKKDPKPDAAAAAIDVQIDPMDSLFDGGWLKNTYNIDPAGPNVQTRFPPEPNGYLHIGHAKAIAVDFGMAKKYGGKCNLRFDDTNPDAEEEGFANSIRETVEWLGYKPDKITYSSDKFNELYNLAEELIKKDKAYVCHCTAEETKKQRGNMGANERYACEHRTRPVEESLAEFRKMREGLYKYQSAFLRMKMSIIDNPNPQMWDLPAYRIPEDSRPHHRTGNEWKIYPTYDFTHCLCDAMEKITHSMCTTEFSLSRESYDWLVDSLIKELPAKPQQREFGRLQINGTVLSKRKIAKLVNTKTVRGWDDPRLFTMIALRRRGVPPGAIRAFVADVGVSDSNSIIQTVRLETMVRKYMERTVPRLMVVLDPVKVIIDDLPEDHLEEISIDFLKGDDSFGSHVVPFTRTVYIDRSDFREEDSKDFFRLAPNKTVGLLNVPHPIRCTSMDKDPSTGKVLTIHASYESPAEGQAPVRPKGFHSLGG